MVRQLIAFMAMVCLVLSPAYAISLGTVQAQYSDTGPGSQAALYLDGVELGASSIGVSNLRLNSAAGTHSDEGTGLVQSLMPMAYRAPALRSELGATPASGDQWARYGVIAPADAPVGPAGQALRSARAADLSRLFNKHYDVCYGHADPDGAAAAFQLAVYEIFCETDGTYDTTKGRFWGHRESPSHDRSLHSHVHRGPVLPKAINADPILQAGSVAFFNDWGIQTAWAKYPRKSRAVAFKEVSA